jgi:hypothetical protein
MAWKLNENSEVTYKYAYGDKDLFALGFLLTGQISNFSQVREPPFSLLNSGDAHEAFGQRNPDDPERVAFVHRTHQKRNCISKTNPCLLLPDEYKLMVLEDSGNLIYVADKTKMKASGRPVPGEVMDALRFVAGAERELIKTPL